MFAILYVLCSILVQSAYASIAVYWGQTTGTSLGDFCSSTNADIVIVSFLSEFGTTTTTLNLAGNCETTFSGSSLLDCSDIGSEIKSCQSAGKKVFLSLGGGATSYGFSSDSEAESFAETLWNYFGGGTSSTRPFGDAVVDGFDFDIESGDSTGYAALANALRSTYFPQGSKTFYISAAPQCPLPDASLNDLLTNADVDYAFIQFYNNPSCSIQGSFNIDKWQDATSGFKNTNIKLYVGLPGSSSSAGSGYVSEYSTLESALTKAKSYSNFGGVMLWDAYSSSSNTINGVSYIDAVDSILANSGSSATGASSVVATSSSSLSASVESSSASAATVSSVATISVGSQAAASTASVSSTDIDATVKAANLAANYATSSIATISVASSQAVNTPSYTNGTTIAAAVTTAADGEVLTITESVTTTTVSILSRITVTLADGSKSIEATTLQYTKAWNSWGNTSTTAAAAAASGPTAAAVVSSDGTLKTVTIYATKTISLNGAQQTVYQDNQGSTISNVVAITSLSGDDSKAANNNNLVASSSSKTPSTSLRREIVVKSSSVPITTYYQEIEESASVDPTTTLYLTNTINITYTVPTPTLHSASFYNSTTILGDGTTVSASADTSSYTAPQYALRHRHRRH